MEVAEPAGDLAKRLVAVNPARPWSRDPDHVAWKERKHLSASVVESQRARRAVEADSFEVPEHRVHGWCPFAGRAPYSVADPDRSAGIPAGQAVFFIHALILVYPIWTRHAGFRNWQVHRTVDFACVVERSHVG
nr:hypothetical protein GCM10020092_054460 [Actinoplanes digitatis]